MSKGTEIIGARYEDRLRFHIEHNTSEWKELKAKLAALRKSGDKPNGLLVCIARVDNSGLKHYKYDPIKDSEYPMYSVALFRELLAPDTTIAEVTMLVREKVELGWLRSFVMINSRGGMLVPSTQLKDIKAEYDGEGLVFLRYLDQNSLG